MHALVRTVFSRLHYLDPEVEEAKLRSIDEDTPEGEIKMTVSTAEPVVTEKDPDSQEVLLENEAKPEEPVSLQTIPAPLIDRSQCMLRVNSLDHELMGIPSRWVTLNHRASSRPHQRFGPQ